MQWQADGALRDVAVVQGLMRSEQGESIPVDLLAVDAAYPAVVCPDDLRRAAHQAWQFGEVLLVESDDARVALAVPGTAFDVELVCEVIRRLAKSVGAPADHYSVLISL